MKLDPGERFGSYIVEEQLGQGGMAVVYLVRHELLNTRHALKLLRYSSEKVVQRFLREGRSLRPTS